MNGSITESGQGEPPKLFNIFGLPLELREAIYELAFPAAVDFVFLSPPMFLDWNRGLSKKEIKLWPCGLSFRQNDQVASDSLKNLQSASVRLGLEATRSLSNRNARALATINACIPQTNPTWARDVHPERVTPRLLKLVANSRFIFASFGANTANTLRALDERVRANIKDIFLTRYLMNDMYPGNSQWYNNSDDENALSVLESLFASLPALKKVAVEVEIGQATRNINPLWIMLKWFDTGKIKELELVFPHSNESWTAPTTDTCEELLYGSGSTPTRSPSLHWKVERVSDDEVDARGRWRFMYLYEYWQTATESKLVEGTVFRLIREAKVADESISQSLRERTEEEQEFFSGFADLLL
ncbi:hypothetical protein ABW21_db0206178 [Orbilia brochopaga]|nr:hypothetical protein ABW21_db0206178 [Drechslerella brochopaga]